MSNNLSDKQLVKHLLVDANMSIKELERRAGVIDNHYFQKMRKNTLRVQDLLKILDVLGLKMEFVDK